MKKFLLILTIGSSIQIFSQAQPLITENFEALTLGNLATDPTGAAAGQNGWYIFQGAAADYQVVTVDAAHGKSLQTTTGAGAPPATGANLNTRYAYKPFTTVATPANNILSATMDIYTGPATGRGRVGLNIYNATATAVIGGIVYDYETKRIYGQARVTVVATPTQTGVLSLTLGTETFPANTWVRVRYTYNKTTGAHSYNYSAGTVNATYGFPGNATYSIFTGDVAGELDIVNSTLALNTIANSSSVDNINVQFSTAALLGVNDTALKAKAHILIYPNPVSDVINIITEEKIKNVSIFDISGKKIGAKVSGSEVDVRNLAPGNYLLRIETAGGITTEKFIKK
ncbi:MAG: T9SS type A sorting domain-containing protein [Kaistella sp.]|nr:T9SS type A sorting domain-containing protein [Kaistella sp.]